MDNFDKYKQALAHKDLVNTLKQLDKYKQAVAHKDLVNALKQLNETMTGIHDRLIDIAYRLNELDKKLIDYLE